MYCQLINTDLKIINPASVCVCVYSTHVHCTHYALQNYILRGVDYCVFCVCYMQSKYVQCMHIAEMAIACIYGMATTRHIQQCMKNRLFIRLG